jgi:ribosome recycling factor
MDVVKKGKDGKLAGISKDDAFANAKAIESVTESVMNTLQGMVDKKMDSIMAV